MEDAVDRPPRERVAEVLRDELGCALRVVSYYSTGEPEVVYMRDDVRERYTPEEDDEILREMLFESIGHGRFTELFGSELEATARIFESQVVTAVPLGDREGVVVSLERDGDFSYLDVLAECQRLLGA